MVRLSFLALAVFLCAAPLSASAHGNLSLAQAQKLVPERVWSKRSEALRLGAIQAGKRRFWAAHIYSPRPDVKVDDGHGQYRLIFLERVSEQWSYLGHYTVDCAPVCRKGNRIWYYEERHCFTQDENSPPSSGKISDRFGFSDHYVFRK